MAKIFGKIALIWVCGTSLTHMRPCLVPAASTTVKSKGPITLLRKTQRSFPSYRSMSGANTIQVSPHPMKLRENINLSDKENQIFDHLVRVLNWFNLKTQLRVAGGWVRDKLLGKECYDIDIALDNMLGKEFCEKVNEYLLSTGKEAHGIAVIQSNPDQSKHLETARMRIFDVWIDFVNLRSEDYTENSRIPTMRFGTAEEDAFRRDLTINSLFYNINTQSVEDFTGRGIDDLKNGKIVTPLPPKETFLDDPLRVLRAIRFGARFDFEIDTGLKDAAADNDVIAAISNKISRERIGHEIDLMVSGNQPVKAVRYICDLSLYRVVFGMPPECESDGDGSICVYYMDAAWRLWQSVKFCTLNDEQRRLFLYAGLFLPFRKTVYKDKQGKVIPVVRYIFRDSLKLKSNDSDTVVKIHNAVEKFLSLIPFFMSSGDFEIEVDWTKEIIDVSVSSKLRILTGLLIWEIKDFWRAALLLSTLFNPTDIRHNCGSYVENNDFELVKRGELFKTIEKQIIELGLEKAWEAKPLVNGKEIMGILQLKSGGPAIREWQEKSLQWQLAHPHGNSEECIDWMVKQTQLKRARIE